MTKLGSLNKDTDVAKVQEMSNLSVSINDTTDTIEDLSSDIFSENGIKNRTMSIEETIG